MDSRPMLEVLADVEKVAREVEATTDELARLLVGHSEPREVLPEPTFDSVLEQLGKLNLRQSQTLGTLRLIQRMLVGEEAEKFAAERDAKSMYLDQRATTVSRS